MEMDGNVELLLKQMLPKSKHECLPVLILEANRKIERNNGGGIFREEACERAEILLDRFYTCPKCYKKLLSTGQCQNVSCHNIEKGKLYNLIFIKEITNDEVKLNDLLTFSIELKDIENAKDDVIKLSEELKKDKYVTRDYFRKMNISCKDSSYIMTIPWFKLSEENSIIVATYIIERILFMNKKTLGDLDIFVKSTIDLKNTRVK